jgi:hypothetical protein
MKVKSIALVTLPWLLVTLAGCASSGLLKVSKPDYPKSGPKNPVVRILGVWEPAMGIGIEDKTSRGFSGQIYFFSQGSDLAAKVDGDVRIYVFDDEGTADEQMKPLHEMNFPAATWNALLTKGPLGATYNVFVPYIRPGNHEAKCTLRIRYKAADGPIAYSDFVDIVLEGKKKPDAAHDYDDAGTRSKARTRSGDSRPTQMAEAAEPRSADGPPRARGLSEAITASLELDRQTRRPRAVALTEQERERIIREVRARMKAENNGDVALAAYDDGDKGPVPAARKSSSRQPPNPLQEEAEVSDDEGVETAAEEFSEEPSGPIRRHRSAIRRHILADEDVIDETGESSAMNDSDGADLQSHLLDDAQ